MNIMLGYMVEKYSNMNDTNTLPLVSLRIEHLLPIFRCEFKAKV
jgi:hypothetical protein